MGGLLARADINATFQKGAVSAVTVETGAATVQRGAVQKGIMKF
jgi:hypothetical protein